MFNKIAILKKPFATCEKENKIDIFNGLAHLYVERNHKYLKVFPPTL